MTKIKIRKQILDYSAYAKGPAHKATQYTHSIA